MHTVYVKIAFVQEVCVHVCVHTCVCCFETSSFSQKSWQNYFKVYDWISIDTTTSYTYADKIITNDLHTYLLTRNNKSTMSAIIHQYWTTHWTTKKPVQHKSAYNKYINNYIQCRILVKAWSSLNRILYWFMHIRILHDVHTQITVIQPKNFMVQWNIAVAISVCCTCGIIISLLYHLITPTLNTCSTWF